MNDAPQRPIFTPDTIPVVPPTPPTINVVKVPQVAPRAPRWPIYFFIFAILLSILAAIPFIFPGVGAMLRNYLQDKPAQQQQQPEVNQIVLPPKDLTQREARALALRSVVEAGGPEQIRSRVETLTIVDARTITTDYGWIFFWNTKKFLETGDIRFSIPGAGPIVVTKQGIVEFLATDKSPLEAIDEYEVRIGVRPAPIESTATLTATSTNSVATTTSATSTRVMATSTVRNATTTPIRPATTTPIR